MKYVIVTSVNCDRDKADDDDLKVVFNIACDNDGRPNPVGHSFGWRGVPNYDDARVYPFILKRTGQIDFGSGIEDEGRYGTTSILELSVLEVGATFEFNEDDDRDQYQICRIKWLE